MVVREKLYTAEEFFEIAALPENEDKRLELDDGVIVEMAACEPFHMASTLHLTAVMYCRDLRGQ